MCLITNEDFTLKLLNSINLDSSGVNEIALDFVKTTCKMIVVNGEGKHCLLFKNISNVHFHDNIEEWEYDLEIYNTSYSKLSDNQYDISFAILLGFGLPSTQISLRFSSVDIVSMINSD